MQQIAQNSNFNNKWRGILDSKTVKRSNGTKFVGVLVHKKIFLKIFAI